MVAALAQLGERTTEVVFKLEFVRSCVRSTKAASYFFARFFFSRLRARGG